MSGSGYRLHVIVSTSVLTFAFTSYKSVYSYTSLKACIEQYVRPCMATIIALYTYACVVTGGELLYSPVP